MRLLTVPNWSFGRDTRLLAEVRDRLLSDPDLTLHYAESDVDHNRTVTAFSGPSEPLQDALLDLAHLILPAIDLNRHTGVHPRIGGLDVLPILPLTHPEDPIPSPTEINEWVHITASRIATTYEIPIFLYEKSEQGRHESDLPALRKGGFGSLAERSLNPDFGPKRAHPQLGVTIMGWRDFLIALNVNLDLPDPTLAKQIARDIRAARSDGDPRFLGVRALGFPLASRQLSQVSLNLTLPDLTPIDPIIAEITRRATNRSVSVAGTELIGVIRPKDLVTATHLAHDPDQIVE